jgi:CRISPR-associated protein Csh1
MIKELTQFIETVPKIIKERALEPKAGLHVLLKFDEKGNADILGSERYLGKKHGETSQFLKECTKKQEAAWMIDTNKCLSKSKDIHSASPYCFGIKRESWIGGEFYEINKQGKPKPTIEDRIEDYFNQCCSQRFNLNEQETLLALQFKNWIKKKLNEVLSELINTDDLNEEDYIILYNDIDFELYNKFQNTYRSDGLFNTSEFNIEVEGQILGTSNFYNGFNSKKPFLTHQTAAFDITGRISAQEAKALTEFQLYSNKRLLPNPLPIFIDAPELTQDAINIFHRDENIKPNHREIISELWKRKGDLGNYYLIYFSGGAIKDFDFVSKFNYHLHKEKETDDSNKPWKIENVTEIKDKSMQSTIELHSVFDFERVVIRQLFNNSLVKVNEKKNEVSMRYFEDIDAKYYRPALYTLILKYRKPIYDFIYKSMRNGIGRVQFEDICLTGIIDDLKENKDYSIKAKLNLYFSLYQYFETNKTTQIMPSKIEELKDKLEKILVDADIHIQTDEEYAFGAGQLIYYLLSKSEAAERTHAVLEPFLQKTNHSHFNEAIANTLMRYKHAIGFDQKRFNKLSSEILGYIPETGLQVLRPLLLAGYFCPNIFYTKQTDSQN